MQTCRGKFQIKAHRCDDMYNVFIYDILWRIDILIQMNALVYPQFFCLTINNSVALNSKDILQTKAFLINPKVVLIKLAQNNLNSEYLQPIITAWGNLLLCGMLLSCHVKSALYSRGQGGDEVQTEYTKH